MTMRTLTLLTLMATLALSVSAAAPPAAAERVTAAEAFEQLKSLAGDWSGPMMTKDGPEGADTFEVTAGGSIVLERLFPGQPYEMLTVYHMDGDDLLATHYCSGGNQPRVKLNVAKSTRAELVFEFVSVTGLESPDETHINGARLSFPADGQLDAMWTSTEGEPKLFFLKRKQ